ncbi:MAG: hypothetical protein FJZ01_27135, partial [Candidatus Sericytochromatia bacterium]|nr:hypothetical protein [Candidatus Tanganyikabacteria bacterium]
VRQRCTTGSCGSGACTRVTRYDPQSGRYMQANTSYSGVTNPTCGSSSYRSGSYRYRHVTGGAVNVSGYKYVLRRYGGMERMNPGWGLDARNSGYRCNLWYGMGTSVNNIVFMGNNGCQGTTYQMAISNNWTFNWTSPGLGPGGHITW